MEKVTIEFMDHCFKLKIDRTSPGYSNDLASMKDALSSYAETKNAYINSKLSNHFPIFSKFDEKRGKFIEIDDDDEIACETDRVCLKLSPFESPTKTKNKTPEDARALATESNKPPVVQPAFGLTIDDYSEQRTNEPPIEPNENSEGIESIQPMELDANESADLYAVSKPKKKRSGGSSTRLYTLDEIPLPQFRPSNLKIIGEGKFLLDSGPVIDEATSFLLHEISWRPTSGLYEVYTKALLAANPTMVFKCDPGQDCWEFVKDMIVKKAKYIRRRDRQNQSLLDLEADPAQKQKKQQKLLPTQGNDTNPSEPNNINEDLPDFNSRIALAKAEMTLAAAIGKIPSYSDYKNLVSDLGEILGVSSCLDAEKFDVFYRKLSSILELPCRKESEKLLLLHSLEKKLHPHSLKKCPKAFNYIRLADPTVSTVMPSQIISIPPVSVAYVSPCGNIKKAFILGENRVLYELKNPMASEIICLLHSMYYIFDLRYPRSSHLVFEFLDSSLWGKEIKSQSKTFKAIMNLFSEEV